MQEFNAVYRGVNRATDVLSFPQQNSDELRVKSYELKEKKKNSKRLTCHPPLFLGDIVISIPTAERQAKIYGGGFTMKFTVLWFMGYCICLGMTTKNPA